MPLNDDARCENVVRYHTADRPHAASRLGVGELQAVVGGVEFGPLKSRDQPEATAREGEQMDDRDRVGAGTVGLDTEYRTQRLQSRVGEMAILGLAPKALHPMHRIGGHELLLDRPGHDAGAEVDPARRFPPHP